MENKATSFPRTSTSLLMGYLVLLSTVAVICSSLSSAQIPAVQTAQGPAEWHSTTDLQSAEFSSQRIPVRISESHSQSGNRTIDERLVEIRGTDGHVEPYQEIERETLNIDASTVRTTTRTFARDVNGRRSLVQETEEETHIMPNDQSSVVRVTSNPDLNGRLQPVQREIVETRKSSENLEETNTTVMLTNINGGLAPAFKTHELRERATNDSLETEKTTSLPDINGKWQLSEIRRETTTQEAGGQRIEETVFRPNAEGKLTQISCVISQTSESHLGEKRSSLESYSIDVPGTSEDGTLHLVERMTSTEISSSTGEHRVEKRLDQINPGDPGAGLRLSVVVDGKLVPTASGEQSEVTIRTRDSNGSFGVVAVDTTKSDRVPTIEFQQTPGDLSK